MNLKEKWTKQNNSVRLLLRKLKRHDTVVVAIAVVIAVMLCGGLIYLSTPVVAASAKEDLEQIQGRDNEQTIEKLDELSEYLDGLDKSLSESKESLSSFYEKDGADKLLSEKNTEKMTSAVTEKVTGLGDDMNNLHNSISRTGEDIERLRELITKGGEDSGKAIADSFTNIYNNLEEIENTYNKTQENTKSLIDEIQNALKSGDDKLSKELLDNYNDLLEKLNESNEKLANQDNESIRNFKELNTNLDNYFKTINVSIESDMTNLKTYLMGELSGVNGKIDQVFQRVSNGKKLLASTLLTKNIEIREDATFAEIAKAIENIPVQIVLDRDDVPGEVVYEYHYHMDGAGNVCDEEYVPVENKGGCYTHEYVHTHNEDCYNKVITYTYETKEDVENRGWSHDDNEGHPNFYYLCHYCGKKFVNDNPKHAETTTDRSVAERRARNMPKENVSRTLKCTKPEGTLLGYETTCNLLHGQIVAAKIVFSDGYDKYNTSTGVMAPAANITTSLMAAPRALGISQSVLWDDSVWDLSREDDNNSLEKERLEESTDSGHEAPGDTAGSGDNNENNNDDTDNMDENGDNTDVNRESENNAGGNDDGEDNDDSSGGDNEPSDEQNDGDVTAADGASNLP